MPHAATASEADAAAPGGEPVGPLERGLAVLRALAAHPGPRMRPGDLVRATGLARSTVDRIVTTLTHLGYLRIEDDRDVLLAPRLMELGNAYLTCCGLPDALEPLAVALADELDESVSSRCRTAPGCGSSASPPDGAPWLWPSRSATCCPRSGAPRAPSSPPTGAPSSKLPGAPGCATTPVTPASPPFRPARHHRPPTMWSRSSDSGWPTPVVPAGPPTTS